MDGTYIVIRRDNGKAVASINAPYNSDVDNVLACWVAGQGLPETSRQNYMLDWFPFTQWEGALEYMLTPCSEVEELRNQPKPYKPGTKAHVLNTLHCRFQDLQTVLDNGGYDSEALEQADLMPADVFGMIEEVRDNPGE